MIAIRARSSKLFHHISSPSISLDTVVPSPIQRPHSVLIMWFHPLNHGFSGGCSPYSHLAAFLSLPVEPRSLNRAHTSRYCCTANDPHGSAMISSSENPKEQKNTLKPTGHIILCMCLSVIWFKKPLTNWDSHANVSNVSQISLHWQILWRTQRHKDKEAAPNPEIQQPRKVARVTREEFNPTQPWKSNKSNEMPRTKSLMSQLKRYQVVKK